MRHIKAYRIFESEKPVITYDFDGVLHTGVYPGTIHPMPDSAKWLPCKRMIDQMHEDAKTARIYIVTARDGEWPSGRNRYVDEFVKANNLPVEDVICTNNEPKRWYLEKLGSVKHYDDNPELEKELAGTGIEFVLVDPGMNENQEADGHTWYHGTDSKFDTFDMSKTKNGPSAFGLWFCDDKELAKIFGDNVLKCELSYKNPKVISMDRWDDIRGEHAKDTEYFRKWKASLVSQGYDALFVTERTIKFGGHTVRDGNMVCVFDQDDAKILK